jgi:hypothetical protein
MQRILGSAIVVWAACDGGRGLRLETFATLPTSTTSYSLGFDADGAPVIGSEPRPDRLLRFDGASWLAYPGEPLQVLRFGAELDGAPLAVARDSSGAASTEVWRLEAAGAVRLGDPVPDLCFQVLQSGSGTRYLTGGTSTWVLRPGQAAWALLPSRLGNLIRGRDGRFYAQQGPQSSIVRVEDDDRTSPTLCHGALRGVDSAGRIYVSRDVSLDGFDSCDPDTGLTQRFDMPDGSLTSLVVGADFVAVAERTAPGGVRLFVLVPGGTRTAPLLAGAAIGEVGPDPIRPFAFHVDPAGVIYGLQGDWLARLAEPGP